MKLRKNTITMAFATCTLLLVNTSQGYVTVTFAQIGSDVVARWSGTLILEPGAYVTDTFQATTQYFGDSTSLNAQIANGAYDSFNGSSFITTLNQAPTSSTGGTFGFNNTTLRFAALDNDAPDSLTLQFNPAIFTMTWANRNLLQIGADQFNDTAAWQGSATTADSAAAGMILYKTIPEPTGLFLAGISGISLLLLRRRS